MRGASDDSAWQDAPRVRTAGWLLTFLCLLAVLLAVTGSVTAAGAQELGGENDSEPPTWENATKAGPEEIALTVTDNSTIDRASITTDDFTVSEGNVSNVSFESTDGGLTVVLLLEDRLDVDTVTVSFTESGGVADTAGNELTTGSKTVTGMDTTVPDFRRFSLTRINDSTAEVRVRANEPLSALGLSVTGPVNDRLTRANFTAVDGSNTTFVTRYTVPEFGAYSFVWDRAVDSHGNLRTMSRMRQFRYEDSAPDIVLDGPETTTVETTANFSAAETVDEDGIDSYRWRIDGGTVLSGPSIQVAFAAPGWHDVTLEVTDSKGYRAVETRVIEVEQSADSPVSVTTHNATYANATVEGSGLVQQIRAINGSVVGTDTVALERLSAAFPVNTSVSLSFRATDGPPDSFDRQSFGLFGIEHDSAANRVSLGFSVDRASLNRTGVAPDQVALYRDTGGWTRLSTSVVDRQDDRVVYQATAPGLSQFVVGTDTSAAVTGEAATSTTETGSSTDGTEGSGPTAATEPVARSDISVTNVTVNVTDPTVGQTVRINVTATNQGDADGRYPFSVGLNGSSVATHELSVSAGATVTRSYEQNLSTAGELSVAGTPVTNVSASSGGSLLPGSVAGLLSGLPNPLALWPSGIVGTVLGALIGLVVVVYGILKALAIYLGY